MIFRTIVYLQLIIVFAFTFVIDFNTEISAKEEIASQPARVETISQTNKAYHNVTKVHSGTSGVDIREVVLEEYFRGTPLAGTAEYFTNACDQLGAPHDCTTVAAIAQHETNLCTYYTSANTFNCWGFGGPGVYRWTFNSFEESIYTVTDVLVNQYGIQYMLDPRLMENVFCGPQAECEYWGEAVVADMNDINNLSISMGYGPLFDLR